MLALGPSKKNPFAPDALLASYDGTGLELRVYK